MGNAHAITVAAKDSGQTRSGEKERPTSPRQPCVKAPPLAQSAWRRGATALLGQRFMSSVGGRLAAGRGQALALVYHRVRPEPLREYEIVPCVAVGQFREHVEALLTMGDIVPAGELITSQRSRRPRFALTFDDDYATHFSYVLPVLRELSVPATFFLSGRALHGLGPYWWEVLESRMRQDGPDRVATGAGRSQCGTASHRRGVRGRPGRQQPPRGRLGRTPATSCARTRWRLLAAAGMTIGFHTVTHPVLPRLAPPGPSPSVDGGSGAARRPHWSAADGSRLSARPGRRRHRRRRSGPPAMNPPGPGPGGPSAVEAIAGAWGAGKPARSTRNVLRARALARLLRPASADG